MEAPIEAPPMTPGQLVAMMESLLLARGFDPARAAAVAAGVRDGDPSAVEVVNAAFSASHECGSAELVGAEQVGLQEGIGAGQASLQQGVGARQAGLQQGVSASVDGAGGVGLGRVESTGAMGVGMQWEGNEASKDANLPVIQGVGDGMVLGSDGTLMHNGATDSGNAPLGGVGHLSMWNQWGQ
ncbi:unnamed protein product [Closterium sp. NIES-64]|nr:unnamed protein product [Closterium sp. NIES-64]